MFIAITGGIGSGKSLVMSIISQLGGAIISADKINDELITKPSYIRKIAEVFPSVVQNGSINKRMLGKIVFYDEKEMIKLSDIAHPEIKKEIDLKMKELSYRNDNVFVEVPLLVECNMTHMFDKIWVIIADLDMRIQRIMMRDLVGEDYAKKIMQNQLSDDERKRYATDLINNNGSYEDLYKRVKELYTNLSKCRIR